MPDGQTQFASTPWGSCASATPFHEGVEKALGPAIKREHGRTVQSSLGTSEQNIPVRFLQIWQSKPDHQECRAKIVSQRAIETFDPVDVSGRVGDEDASVVYEHIDLAKTPNG